LLPWPPEGHRDRSFELLGFDILLTTKYKPYLLEINTNPGIHLLTDVVKEHHPRAVEDLFKVILDFPNEWRDLPTNANADEINKLNNKNLFGAWKLIYKGAYDPTVKYMTQPVRKNVERIR